MSGGKYGPGLPIVNLSERVSPIDTLTERLRSLGATEEIIGSAIDTYQRGREDLTVFTDEELAARIGAILSGSTTEWQAIDNAKIEAARQDPDMWSTAREIIVGTVPTVIRWVGTDPGRAVVAHEAELATAEDEGRIPRVTLVKFLALIHGKTGIGLPG